MAYLEMGMSQAQLRQKWEEESGELPLTELYARFGKPQFSDPKRPPYRFLLDELSDPRSVPTYNELRRPDLTDEQRRQYTLAQPDGDRSLLYIRLPKGITARENRDGAAASERQDFPRNGDKLELRTPAGDTMRVTVQRVVQRQLASGLIELQEELPELEARDPEKEERRLERQIARYKRKFKIEEGDTEPSPETLDLVTRVGRAKKKERGASSQDPHRIATLKSLEKIKHLH